MKPTGGVSSNWRQCTMQFPKAYYIPSFILECMTFHAIPKSMQSAMNKQLQMKMRGSMINGARSVAAP